MNAYTPILFCIFAFQSLVCHAQLAQQTYGARSEGMGNTASTLKGCWSAFNNPAGLSYLTSIEVLAGYRNSYGISGLGSAAAGISAPVLKGYASISVIKFGDDIYNEIRNSISYSHQLGNTTLGARMNYHQYHIENYGTKGFLYLDIGGITALSKQLFFGAYIRNINQSSLSDFHDERIPTIMYAGISYLPTNKLIVNIEAEKDIDYDANFKIGLEYEFLKKFLIRTGINTFPFNHFLGIGFKHIKFNIDYAYSNNQYLGNTHQVSLNYKINKHE